MVNRCICSAISFEEVWETAQEQNYTDVQDLIENRVCCVNCKLCKPYVEQLLRTGQTSFSPGFNQNEKAKPE